MSYKEALQFPEGSLFLVTGGAGFIGSNLCEAILNLGYRVRCLDDLSTGKQENNEYGEDGSRNPFNIYLGGGVGIDVAGIQVILGYDHSLTNISKVDKVSTGRSQIKIGVGYAF